MTNARHKLIFIGGLILLLALLTACFGGGDAVPQVSGVDAALLPQTQATLVCNTTCADRGQCGTLDDGSKVVLLASFGPEVVGHDLIVADNTAVIINAMQDMLLQKVIDPNTQYAIHFYQVQPPDKPAAWVAGWCIQQPIP